MNFTVVFIANNEILVFMIIFLMLLFIVFAPRKLRL